MTTTASPDAPTARRRPHIALIVIAGVLVAAILLAVGLFASVNTIRKTMIAKETALSAQYSDNQNALSSYVSSIKEALGVADRNTDALDRVLADAVKGRYEGDTSAQPGGGQLFSAIAEAYPDLNGVSINYGNVQSAIFAGRDAYRNQQSRLLDLIRDYDSWRDGGFYTSAVTSALGAPSQRLRATIGDDTVTGQPALERMQRIVTTSESDQAYGAGQMDPLETNPSAPAATPQPVPGATAAPEPAPDPPVAP